MFHLLNCYLYSIYAQFVMEQKVVGQGYEQDDALLVIEHECSAYVINMWLNHPAHTCSLLLMSEKEPTVFISNKIGKFDYFDSFLCSLFYDRFLPSELPSVLQLPSSQDDGHLSTYSQEIFHPCKQGKFEILLESYQKIWSVILKQDNNFWSLYLYNFLLRCLALFGGSGSEPH